MLLNLSPWFLLATKNKNNYQEYRKIRTKEKDCQKERTTEKQYGYNSLIKLKIKIQVK